MEWLLGLEIALAVLAGATLAFLVWMWVRRRWLSERGGVFDCALKLSDQQSGGWALGMARYRGDEFQWFRVFSLAFRPRLVLPRRETTWVSQRTPDQEESMVLFTDHQVVTLRGRDRRGRERTFELAMPAGSVTGLMSWLEAAPPGLSYPDLSSEEPRQR